ncbi:MAG: mandelate racemase/muconate lactonizing enzyme family protein [Armatimonadota bacterium]|nr:MAG: mandelate racemase/muconate lactonizing enzyme family protein [Armatimonadota bacterium]
MEVVSAKVYLVEIGGRRPVILEAMSDEGLTGLGEAAVAYGVGASAAAAMAKELAERFLLGSDPFRIEDTWSRMYDHTFWAKGGGPIAFAGMSAVETALWDIKGKALGVPVYEMRGGKCRDDVRVYANGWSFRCVEPAEFAREAERVVSDGYDALKLYPLAQPDTSGGHGFLEQVSHRSIDREAEDLAVSRVKAVRDAVGTKVDVMLDMSGELTADAIIRIGRRMEEFDIFFFEEPVDPFDVAALKKVSAHVNMPIAVGERLYTRYGFRPVMEQQAADILQPDIGNTGGIMETKKIAAMAEAYSMRIQPHVCASPISTAAALQLDACIPNFVIQELYPYRVPEHFAIVDHAPELEVKNGRLPIPDGPGLGVALAQDRVESFLYAECGLG